jgi:CBS domain-containing protein
LLELLTSHHITGAPVLSGSHVVGVVSLTDLAEFVSSTPGVSSERGGQAPPDVFDEPVERLPDEEPPSAYFAQIWEDSGGEVIERFDTASGPEGSALDEHTVAEAMNRTILSMPPGAPVEDAAALMQRSGIHRVLVMDGRNLVGIVSTKDVSNAVAEQRLTKRVYVFDRQRES